MLNETSIIKLNKNILKRYEHNIKDGVLFLFDVETEEIWTGNSSSNDVIALIDGKKNLKNIYAELQKIFIGYAYEELRESFDSLLQELIDKKFLEYEEISVC
jgi:hypothetical protein